LFVGASTYVFSPSTPTYHLVAGVFESGISVNLQYTLPDVWIGAMAEYSPYMPNLRRYEVAASICGEEDLPYNDHLAEITVPVLYVGAAGGWGEYGLYVTTLLGSTDVTSHIIQLHPPEEVLLDFGHSDIHSAENAVSLVFPAIANWIENH